MKYMGSKAKLAKNLLGLMLKDRTNNQTYVEPFVGGCNVIGTLARCFRGARRNK